MSNHDPKIADEASRRYARYVDAMVTQESPEKIARLKRKSDLLLLSLGGEPLDFDPVPAAPPS